jgi:hypothetical protein
LDQPDGEAISYVDVPNTGSENEYEKVTAKIKKTQGVHNLFYVFVGGEFRFDSWKFEQI